MKKSRPVVPVPQDESPLRHLPLVDLLVDTRTELLRFSHARGSPRVHAMLEDDRTAICSPR